MLVPLTLAIHLQAVPLPRLIVMTTIPVRMMAAILQTDARTLPLPATTIMLARSMLVMRWRAAYLLKSPAMTIASVPPMPAIHPLVVFSRQ